MQDRRGAFRNKKVPPRVEREFYDVIASKPLLGLVLSQRRAFILDGTALLIALARKIGATVTILDVGCHAGHQTIAVAKYLGLKTVGCDDSPKAILTAKAHVPLMFPC